MATTALAPADIKQMRLPELREALVKASGALRRIRDGAKRTQESIRESQEERADLFMDGVLTVSGGAAVGMLRGGLKDPRIPIVDLPLDYTLGIAATIAGLIVPKSRGIAGVGTFGHGMLAGVAACDGAEHFKKWREQPSG